VIPLLSLLANCLVAQVPDSGTRHDRRSNFLEMGVSVNTGAPDVFRPQLELMAKHRGWPVFASGRFGLGIGDWLDNTTVFVTPQLAIHWTRDGDDSWALRLGWVMGQWIRTEMADDTTDDHAGYAKSTLLGNSLALERTAYFSSTSNVAWRMSVGGASAWHQYEYKGAPWGPKSDGFMPFLDVGILWTAF